MKQELPNPQVSDEKKFELERKRWVNRRRMAWLSLMFLIFVGLWVMFWADQDRIKAAEEILSTVVFSTASVVGVYMGLSTWAEKK